MAVALARLGHKTGLMDGDIYGPSMPTMLGVRGVPPQLREGRLVPLYVHGIHAVTIGSLVESDKPLIWRGPMAHGAFKQLLVDQTTWPELDYLIVDLPPGTGDVPLSLCQLLPLKGAVVVATPQQVALDDCIRVARREVTRFIALSSGYGRLAPYAAIKRPALAPAALTTARAPTCTSRPDSPSRTVMPVTRRPSRTGPVAVTWLTRSAPALSAAAANARVSRSFSTIW